MSINKHSHHSNILKALGVPSVDVVIKYNAVRLYKNIFKANTPARNLQSVHLGHFILKGTIIQETHPVYLSKDTIILEVKIRMSLGL